MREDDRHLSGQEVQSLQAHFHRLTKDMHSFFHAVACEHPPITSYLRWLAEDAELAQQVANAWNEVVRRGEADAVLCECNKCKTVRVG